MAQIFKSKFKQEQTCDQFASLGHAMCQSLDKFSGQVLFVSIRQILK